MRQLGGDNSPSCDPAAGPGSMPHLLDALHVFFDGAVARLACEAASARAASIGGAVARLWRHDRTCTASQRGHTTQAAISQGPRSSMQSERPFASASCRNMTRLRKRSASCSRCACRGRRPHPPRAPMHTSPSVSLSHGVAYSKMGQGRGARRLPLQARPAAASARLPAHGRR